MIRAIVTSVVEGVIKRFSAAGRSGETFSSREYLQHYGFTSRPMTGAELVVIREGNNIIAVASDDRRYRLSLENGEVALYDNQGQHVHLKKNGIIDVLALARVRVTAPDVEVVASTQVTMTTPLLAVSGNITCANLTAATNVSDAGGAKTMAGMRGVYNSHNHGGSGPIGTM